MVEIIYEYCGGRRDEEWRTRNRDLLRFLFSGLEFIPECFLSTAALCVSLCVYKSSVIFLNHKNNIQSNFVKTLSWLVFQDLTNFVSMSPALWPISADTIYCSLLKPVHYKLLTLGLRFQNPRKASWWQKKKLSTSQHKGNYQNHRLV